MSTRGERLWAAAQALAQTAQTETPSGNETLDVILLAAVAYCAKELDLSTKDACDLIDIRFCALFESLGADT